MNKEELKNKIIDMVKSIDNISVLQIIHDCVVNMLK